MKQLTIKDIRNLNPCYDPNKYLPEDWTGTVVDILNIEECSATDRIWVAVRLIPRFIVEAFAIDCAVRSAAAAAAGTAAFGAAYAAGAAAFGAAAFGADYAAGAAAVGAAVVGADYAARQQERENQIDALLMLCED